MRKLLVCVAGLFLTGCVHHPVDCAIGVPWGDCLPGTAGYSNGGGDHSVQNTDAQCRSYGLVFGTADYAKCRSDLDKHLAP